MSNALTETPQSAISKGSHSFYLASLFFSEQEKADCWKLYQWCRYCDDQVDNASSAEAAEQSLNDLRLQTAAAFRAEPDLSPGFQNLSQIAVRHQIPLSYAEDLLAGFAMDVQKVHYRSIQDLELYAYRVAGVVGLMMSKIMGVTSPLAKAPAIAMGNAMQLTNIARDVAEDFGRGRIYLPEEWLMEEGIEPTQLLAPSNRQALYRVVMRLLDRADRLYQQGRAGLHYIPLRSRLAVSMASMIYRQIGVKIRRRGLSALENRVVVPFYEKLFLAFKGAVFYEGN